MRSGGAAVGRRNHTLTPSAADFMWVVSSEACLVNCRGGGGGGGTRTCPAMCRATSTDTVVATRSWLHEDFWRTAGG